MQVCFQVLDLDFIQALERVPEVVSTEVKTNAEDILSRSAGELVPSLVLLKAVDDIGVVYVYHGIKLPFSGHIFFEELFPLTQCVHSI